MCGSMADIQSAAADIRRGKKKKEEEERTNHSMKIYMVSLFHRATINKQGQQGSNQHLQLPMHTHTHTHTNIYQYTKSKHVNEIYV